MEFGSYYICRNDPAKMSKEQIDRVVMWLERKMFRRIRHEGFRDHPLVYQVFITPAHCPPPEIPYRQKGTIGIRWESA